MRAQFFAIVGLCMAPGVGAESGGDLRSDHEVVHNDHEIIEEMTVWGRAEHRKGTAQSASEGLVGYADFSTRPLSRVGELVEVVPGMVATQHSGEGKANQYFLRGMNLDHGTDFSVFIEGMPVNQRSHAHGQGYLDLNFLIPELVSTVEFRKGPYYADAADFSTAGTTQFSLYDRLDAGFVELTAGSDAYYRLVAANSYDVGEDHLLLGFEALSSDGPWALRANVEKLNGLAKYKTHLDGMDVSIILSAYRNEWRSTDQIPERAVPTIGRFGFIDSSLGGKSHRVSLIGNVTAPDWNAGVYVVNYGLNLFQNPTYFLEDPINGDAIEQHDSRWTLGGSAERKMVFGNNTLRYGADVRFDAIADANLHRTRARERIELLIDDELDELSLGMFGELETRWNERFRSVLGVRAYHYRFDVNALSAADGGNDSDSIVLPKLALAYALNEAWEFYANYGQGFHSNDIRGVTIAIDPVEALVRQQGAELGFRFETSAFNLSLAGFWLESDSELLFVGDSGVSEPSDGTRRFGVELDLFWQPLDTIVLDVNASRVSSRFKGLPGGEDYVPNTHGLVLSGGLTYVDPDGLTASIRARHFGDSPLLEDNSVGHGSTTLINLGLSYAWQKFTFGVDVFNLLDSSANDIAFFFESQLPGEPEPVEDLHFHPVEPFSVRASVRMEI